MFSPALTLVPLSLWVVARCPAGVKTCIEAGQMSRKRRFPQAAGTMISREEWWKNDPAIW